MNKILKIFICLVVFVSILFVALFTCIGIIMPDLGSTYFITRIDSKNKKDSIFIKQKNWGLLGNSQLIVISKSSAKFEKPDIESEYVYKNLYYKQNNDTLYIYSTAISSVPKDFHSSFIIVQKEIMPHQTIGTDLKSLDNTDTQH